MQLVIFAPEKRREGSHRARPVYAQSKSHNRGIPTILIKPNHGSGLIKLVFQLVWFVFTLAQQYILEIYSSLYWKFIGTEASQERIRPKLLLKLVRTRHAETGGCNESLTPGIALLIEVVTRMDWQNNWVRSMVLSGTMRRRGAIRGN